jgi:hypothetical protein
VVDGHTDLLLDDLAEQLGAAAIGFVLLAEIVDDVDLVAAVVGDFVHVDIARQRDDAYLLGRLVDRDDHHHIGAPIGRARTAVTAQ